jgi:hypothetical protein
MEESAGRGSRSSRSTNTSSASPPSARGEPSRHISLPSHPAGRGSHPPSQASSSRTPQQRSPSISLDDAMSRHAGPGPTTVTTSRPQQYQLVSPGTPADPRTMSQVSPGFIFVIFPMFAVALDSIPPYFSFCPYLSPMSFPVHLFCIAGPLGAPRFLSRPTANGGTEQQGPADPVASHAPGQHHHRAAPHREDLCIPRFC